MLLSWMVSTENIISLIKVISFLNNTCFGVSVVKLIIYTLAMEPM
jgi:hypothetical protein